jgi:cation-transporting ATPase E
MEVRGAITGPELETLQGEEYAEIVARTNVFARISPEEKKRIAAQLARRGAYVAMVGDGVNDVPALKEARMGIAMANGAQMAKDVSDLVLMDNALTTLPKAMAEGELTTQKIYASTRMLLSKNTYMILAVILVGFMALPFPGQVRQLSWVTIMTTGVPSLLVSLGLLRPRRVRDFTREVIGMVIVTGVLGALVLAAVYAIAYFGFGNDVNMARSALSMVALAYGVVVYWDVQGVSPFLPRSFRRRPREAAVGVLLVIAGIAGPVILPGFFQLAPMPWQLWGTILTMSVVSAYLYWRSTLARPRLIEPIRVLIHAGRD